MLDVVHRQALNIDRMSHQMPHQQGKAPDKEVTLLYSPLQQQLEEGAVDGIGLLLISVDFLFCFRKLLPVAEHEGVNLGVNVNRQQLVSDLRSILYGIIEH